MMMIVKETSPNRETFSAYVRTTAKLMLKQFLAACWDLWGGHWI